MKFKMTGIILAGGKNSRMGTNKAFLKLDGILLIERIKAVLNELFPEIIIVTNDPLSYTRLFPRSLSRISTKTKERWEEFTRGCSSPPNITLLLPPVICRLSTKT